MFARAEYAPRLMKREQSFPTDRDTLIPPWLRTYVQHGHFILSLNRTTDRLISFVDRNGRQLSGHHAASYSCG